VIFLDPPAWPGRGRLWSHLVSDVSYAELHAFAELLGIPRRGFDGDHYDLPSSRYEMAVWLGARSVPSLTPMSSSSRNPRASSKSHGHRG